MSDRTVDHLTWRHRLVALLRVAAVAIVVARLAQLQIADHDHYLEQATAARLGAAVLPAPRGAILDASGYPLAISVVGDAIEYMGVARATFIIGKDGNVAKVWPKVDPNGHGEDVLAWLRDNKD